ncbi:glycosyltransferase family 4 protein [Microbacterium sp. B35-30]|uniref:glycosyltransferase family 4 protein n=1 Tax=Microbacterium sp. B35-30 TaxID=1962642 RepID=UPI0031F2E35B
MRDERRLIGAANGVLTLSQKDADLMQTLYAPRVVNWVNPPLDFQIPIEPPSVNQPARILFVGAFDRTENAHAAHWLLDNVWPLVRQVFPDARVVLAGSSPDVRLQKRGEADSSVEITGYLDSLDGEYRRASVIVVPLHQGAGVKFKTIHALLAGRPVVSTRIGIEGILDPDSPLLWAIADDAESFAHGIISALGRPDDAARVATEAKAWAGKMYSDRNFQADISKIYSGYHR